MVNLWWNRGELWSVDGHFSPAKNLPQISTLFLLTDSISQNGNNRLALPGFQCLRETPKTPQLRVVGQFRRIA
jgi:hypothetical protein